MLEWIYESYDKFTLRTEVSEEKIRVGLKRECLTLKDFFLSFRGLRALWNTQSFHFQIWKKRKEIQLMPVGMGRNSLRGVVHIAFEQNTEVAGTILRINIKPIGSIRWFCRLFLGFCCFFEVASIATAIFNRAAIAAPFICTLIFLGAFGGMKLCRHMATKEIPLIRKTFEELLDRIERQA